MVAYYVNVFIDADGENIGDWARLRFGYALESLIKNNVEEFMHKNNVLALK